MLQQPTNSHHRGIHKSNYLCYVNITLLSLRDKIWIMPMHILPSFVLRVKHTSRSMERLMSTLYLFPLLGGGERTTRELGTISAFYLKIKMTTSSMPITCLWTISQLYYTDELYNEASGWITERDYHAIAFANYVNRLFTNNTRLNQWKQSYGQRERASAKVGWIWRSKDHAKEETSYIEGGNHPCAYARLLVAWCMPSWHAMTN